MTKNILLITTGGTIYGQVANKDKPKGYIPQTIFSKSLEAIKKNIQKNHAISIKIDIYSLCDIDSSDILPNHWNAIINIIVQKFDYYNAFVVTHGTNTLSYTSSALSFAFENIGKPIILTGSQVPIGYSGTDAIMNLENAIKIAVIPCIPSISGVLVVFGSHIITGVRVKKSTSFNYDAFQSFASSSIGRIGRTIDINTKNLRKHISYLDKFSQKAFLKKDLIIKKKFDLRIASFTEFPGMQKNLFILLPTNN